MQYLNKEAIQNLLKGRLTTLPKLHSGEGIFFTSKVGSIFTLDSFGKELIIYNIINDLFLKNTEDITQGTKVFFEINTESQSRLNDVFREYTNQSGDDELGFDKTDVYVKLYVKGGVHISRSQARRILSGLEKFNVVVMDYDKIPMIGQGLLMKYIVYSLINIQK